MTNPLIKIIAGLLLILTINSCCFTVACDLTEPSLQLRIMRDGKNALFGLDAFIPVDSVRLFILEPLGPYYGSYISDSEEILHFIVYDGQYLLEIPGILADTFTVNTVKDTKGCCNSVHVVEVKRNGEVICADDCEMVLEIEI